MEYSAHDARYTVIAMQPDSEHCYARADAFLLDFEDELFSSNQIRIID